MTPALRGLAIGLVACRVAGSAPAPPDTDASSAPDTDPVDAPAGARPPNLLVIVADDLGVDQVGAYREAGAVGPRTPVLDGLASQGLTFDRAYAEAACSPARAAAMTGRHPRRAGIGTWLRNDDRIELPLTDLTLAEVLAEAPVPYVSHAVGKWHLASFSSPTALDHPEAQGFTTYRGAPMNLNGIGSYHAFDKRTAGGEVVRVERYITTDEVDDAIAVLSQASQPWFVWLALHAPHTPIERPPDELVVTPLAEDATPREVLWGMMEAMDTELGRLLAAVEARPDETVVWFWSDNGAANVQEDGTPDPSAQVKGTLFEGGVRVPMIAAGPGIPAGERTEALVHATDLLPTLARIAGAPVPEAVDGVDLSPVLADPSAAVREHVYVERFQPSGPGPWWVDQRAVLTRDWKLIRTPGQGRTLHRIGADGRDGPDLRPTADTDDAVAAVFDALAEQLRVEEAALGLR